MDWQSLNNGFLAGGLFLSVVVAIGLHYKTQCDIERGWFEHKGKVYIITPGEVK